MSANPAANRQRRRKPHRRRIARSWSPHTEHPDSACLVRFHVAYCATGYTAERHQEDRPPPTSRRNENERKSRVRQISAPAVSETRLAKMSERVSIRGSQHWEWV